MRPLKTTLHFSNAISPYCVAKCLAHKMKKTASENVNHSNNEGKKEDE